MTTRIPLLIVCLCWAAMAQQSTVPSSQTGHIVGDVVVASPGEKFGVKLSGAADGTALSITEEPNLNNADLVLSMKQQTGMMLFTIENRTEHWLSYEAGIRVPKRKGFYKTSVMPVGPHLTNAESWPHAIEQLAMKNFRFIEKPEGKPKKK